MILPNSDQGLGIFLAGIGLGILLVLAGRAGWRHISVFGLTFQRPVEKTREQIEGERADMRAVGAVERRQIEAAFARYGEATVGIVPMVGAVGPADRALGAWFDLVAAAITGGLTLRPEDHYRVAIWADLGDPDVFHMLGSANHNRNDPKMATLSKSDTIAGRAWRAKDGEYLCSDITKDRKFKARSPTPRPYRSIFAVRLGDPPGWGVLTIDGPKADCFDQLALVIIRRFAKLISAGAAVAIARYGPTAAPSSPPVAAPPTRIVSAGAAPRAEDGKEPPL